MSDILIGGYADSLYNTYNATKASSGTKLEETLQNRDMSEADSDELMEACKEFEAYFTEQMFKEMQKTVDVWKDDESSGSSSQYKDYAMETLMQEYASSSSEGEGIGLAKMLYEQMKINYNIED